MVGEGYFEDVGVILLSLWQRERAALAVASLLNKSGERQL